MYTAKRAEPKHAKKKMSLWAKLKRKIAKIGTLNIVLAFVFGIFLWFNFRMLQIYEAQGQIPETYACAVVAALLGECGFCGWIRTTKDRKREHKWEQEEKKRENNNNE